ncbi:hypothetical protein EC9_43600 [Rosistilla ulvae]|uniref:Uncharacterized protein n=1 Tax=Rosistilla ulvae TaxID=1930277 RepID=A0A517M5K5_9BACT|nr:hypothetical protein EC9_43600 [Rosistilla ulvae]
MFQPLNAAEKSSNRMWASLVGLTMVLYCFDATFGKNVAAENNEVGRMPPNFANSTNHGRPKSPLQLLLTNRTAKCRDVPFLRLLTKTAG